MPFDFARRHDDPGIVPPPHPERLAGSITPPRRRDWAGIIRGAESFIAGALMGVLLACLLILGWR